FGIVISVVLLSLNVRGGIFYGMLLTSIAGMIFGLIPVPSGVSDVVSGVPSVAPTFGQAFVIFVMFLLLWCLSLCCSFYYLNFWISFCYFGDIFTLEMLVVMLTFLFVDFFDTAGTLVAVARQAGLMKDNKLPRAGKALFADSAATVAGAIVGTSTTTSFVESTSGVGVGGRTGFTSVVTAGFFLLALFFSPLLQ